ncbi:MAG: hypothetical protein Q9165_005345 [Trypethelium subeluteriae]
MSPKQGKISRMSTNVPEIPIEVLSRIFSVVDSKATLKNLILSSKNFYSIAAPHLYSYLELLTADWETPFYALRPLTCLFLRKPELAQHVRHLALRSTFEDGPSSGGKQGNKKLDLDPEIRSAIIASAQSKEEEGQWLEDASEQAHEDCILSLLLPTLTNLHSIDIEMPVKPEYVPRQLERIGRGEHPFDKKPTFSKLTDIHIAHDDSKYGLYTDSIGCAFYLPAIQNIYLHRIGSSDGPNPSDEIAAPLQNIPDGSSAVTSIDMHDCKLSTGDFARMMRAPKALTSFCYEVGWGHLSYAACRFPEMRAELDRHKTTLRDLWLDYVPDGIEWLTEGDDIDDTTPMKSFAEFSALRRIKIGMAMMFGEDAEEDMPGYQNRLVEALPAQIEYVKITRAEDSPDVIVGALENLILQKGGKFPELRHLEIECSETQVNDRKDQYRRLKQLAENEKGLTFVVRDTRGALVGEDYDQRVERKWGFDENIEWQPCTSDCNARCVFPVHDLEK